MMEKTKEEERNVMWGKCVCVDVWGGVIAEATDDSHAYPALHPASHPSAYS